MKTRREQIEEMREEVLERLPQINDLLLERGTVMIAEIINEVLGEPLATAPTEAAVHQYERWRTFIHYIREDVREALIARYGTTVVFVTDAAGQYRGSVFRLVMPEDMAMAEISKARLKDGAVRQANHRALLSQAVENKQITEGDRYAYLLEEMLLNGVVEVADARHVADAAAEGA